MNHLTIIANLLTLAESEAATLRDYARATRHHDDVKAADAADAAVAAARLALSAADPVNLPALDGASLEPITATPHHGNGRTTLAWRGH